VLVLVPVSGDDASDKRTRGDLAGLLRGAADIAAIVLPTRPRLAPWLTLVDLGDGRLQLRAAEFALTVPGGLFADAARFLCPLLDGTRSIEELAEAGLPRYLPGTISFLLKLLQQRGVLQEGAPIPGLSPELRQRHAAALQLFAHHVTDPDHVLARLTASRVALIGSGSVCSRVQVELVALGVGTVANPVPTWEALADAGRPADLIVALSDSAGSALFDAVNRASLEGSARWLRVAFEGRHGVVGPTVVPRQTACFTCYNVRRASHDERGDFEAYRAQLLRDGDPHEGALEALTNIVAAQAALEVARLLTGFAPPATFGRFYVFQAGSPRVSGHEVLRVPRCPSCGRSQSPRDPWDVRSRLDGGAG
jgi:bacteriocin biosynthesis cyclodehydratase domain-containing protein